MFLARLHPDEHALDAVLRAHLDDAMLREIAEADYGWKADECFALLLPIRDTGALPPDAFALREVLELIRWSEPEDSKWSPGGFGPRGHWMRLFACAGLLRLAASDPALFSSEADTLAQFVASALELGEPVARPAASLLSWRFLTAPGEADDRAFLAFAILLLAAHLERNDGSWLKQLADWVEEEEASARKANDWRAGSPGWDDWLLGLTPFRQREEVWRSLSLRILASPDAPHPAAADQSLRLLGELAAGV